MTPEAEGTDIVNLHKDLQKAIEECDGTTIIYVKNLMCLEMGKAIAERMKKRVQFELSTSPEDSIPFRGNSGGLVQKLEEMWHV